MTECIKHGSLTYAERDSTRGQYCMVGCVAQLAERRSLAGELTLFYARPAADG